MSSGFTPSPAVDMSDQKGWPANLGMLDWDNTQVVFTKRSLLEFLKYAGVTVDPNFTNIQKLPKYARFGTIAGYSQDDSDSGASADPAGSSAASEGFRPSRRVRAVPGGATTDIFGVGADDDVLAGAPPRGGVTASSSTAEVAEDAIVAEPETSPESPSAGDARPRTKRQQSSVANLWDAPNPGEFKPTRRVREMPGGKDSISSLF